jgi:hypothetical protein
LISAFGWKRFSDSENFTLSVSLHLNTDAVITPAPAAPAALRDRTWRDRVIGLAQAAARGRIA